MEIRIKRREVALAAVERGEVVTTGSEVHLQRPSLIDSERNLWNQMSQHESKIDEFHRNWKYLHGLASRAIKSSRDIGQGEFFRSGEFVDFVEVLVVPDGVGDHRSGVSHPEWLKRCRSAVWQRRYVGKCRQFDEIDELVIVTEHDIWTEYHRVDVGGEYDPLSPSFRADVASFTARVHSHRTHLDDVVKVVFFSRLYGVSRAVDVDFLVTRFVRRLEQRRERDKIHHDVLARKCARYRIVLSDIASDSLGSVGQHRRIGRAREHSQIVVLFCEFTTQVATDESVSTSHENIHSERSRSRVVTPLPAFEGSNHRPKNLLDRMLTPSHRVCWHIMGRSEPESDRQTTFELLSATDVSTHVAFAAQETEHTDGQQGLYVTALGTGASALGNGRASAGYVVHIDGTPRFILDAGGGTGARISEAGIDLTALDAMFLGHLHIDHTTDVPAIVKAAYQQGRERPLSIYGPTGADNRPGTEVWLSRLFDEREGAYNYLHEFIERYQDSELQLEPTEIDATVRDDNGVTTVFKNDGVTIEAIPETHGTVPTLAYRFSYEGMSVTFSGDTTLETRNLQKLAAGSDILVHNRMLDSETDPDAPSTELHAYPEEIGANACTANVGMLVLSHISRNDRCEIEQEVKMIRQEYEGPIIAIRDRVVLYPDGRVIDDSPKRNAIVVANAG
jgi:ribonuclease Z